MINANMKSYSYFAFGAEDKYGQPELSKEPVGTIKMAIEITSQTIQDNINYSGAQYIGFTLGEINDSHVIKYGDQELKVLYVNPRGRFKQVFMAEM